MLSDPSSQVPGIVHSSHEHRMPGPAGTSRVCWRVPGLALLIVSLRSVQMSMQCGNAEEIQRGLGGRAAS